MILVRTILYLWALPTTAFGFPFLLLAPITGGGVQLVNGVLEIHGGVARFYLRRVVGIFLRGGASAMTLGHIVIGLDRAALERTRKHERVHVHQCERWGPLFIPAYLGAGVIQMLRGRRAYYDNPFEQEAYRISTPRRRGSV